MVSNQGYLGGGGLTLQGDFILPGGVAKNWEIGGFRGAEGAAKIFWELFSKFEIFCALIYHFWENCNKNATKSNFWEVLGNNISKTFKEYLFLGKNTSTNFQKFWDTFTKVPTTPRQKYPWSKLQISKTPNNSFLKCNITLVVGSIKTTKNLGVLPQELIYDIFTRFKWS